MDKGIEESAIRGVEAIAETIADTATRIIISGFRKVMDDSSIDDDLKRKMMPYLYAAGFLSFAGRDINEANLKKAVEVVGIKADSALIKALLNTGITSHIVYVYAYYYILETGKTPTEKNILELVGNFGVEPNPNILKEALEYLK